MTVASRVLARLAALPPAETVDVEVQRDLPMLADPGVVLYADRWFPRGRDAGELPIVLMRTPYGRHQLRFLGRLFAERGYQVVIQSCRGTFGTGGSWTPFRNELRDGRTTLAWLAEQSWWSGSVATFGPSYLGLTQWAVAAAPSPAVKAMSLGVTASRFRDIVIYPGGTFALETGACWLHLLEHQERGWPRLVAEQRAMRKNLWPVLLHLPLNIADQAAIGRTVDYYQDWLAHADLHDPWWDEVAFGADLSTMPPAALVSGWYDIFTLAQVDDFVALNHAGRDATLTIGPWTHGSLQGHAAALREALTWFDRQLRPDRSADGRPDLPVRLWVMGRNQWAELPSWPPPAVPERWYLRASGGLSPEGADGADGGEPDRFRYDPADPTPGTGGASLNMATAGPRDQAEREARPDVLCYTSAPMSRPVTIAGPLNADLWVRPSSPDVDVHLRLCVVSAKGRSTNVSDGMLRLAGDGGAVRSNATPDWGTVTSEADGTLHVQVRIWPTALTVDRRERLRLQVAAGAHPLFARNLGGGEPLGTGTRLVAVDQAVYHDPAHPSSIELPVSTI